MLLLTVSAPLTILLPTALQDGDWAQLQLAVLSVALSIPLAVSSTWSFRLRRLGVALETYAEGTTSLRVSVTCWVLFAAVIIVIVTSPGTGPRSASVSVLVSLLVAAPFLQVFGKGWAEYTKAVASVASAEVQDAPGGRPGGTPSSGGTGPGPDAAGPVAAAVTSTAVSGVLPAAI